MCGESQKLGLPRGSGFYEYVVEMGACGAAGGGQFCCGVRDGVAGQNSGEGTCFCGRQCEACGNGAGACGIVSGGIDEHGRDRAGLEPVAEIAGCVTVMVFY